MSAIRTPTNLLKQNGVPRVRISVGSGLRKQPGHSPHFRAGRSKTRVGGIRGRDGASVQAMSPAGRDPEALCHHPTLKLLTANLFGECKPVTMTTDEATKPSPYSQHKCLRREPCSRPGHTRSLPSSRRRCVSSNRGRVWVTVCISAVCVPSALPDHCSGSSRLRLSKLLEGSAPFKGRQSRVSRALMTAHSRWERGRFLRSHAETGFSESVLNSHRGRSEEPPPGPHPTRPGPALTWPSALAVANLFPSGEKRTQLTKRLWSCGKGTLSTRGQEVQGSSLGSTRLPHSFCC